MDKRISLLEKVILIRKGDVWRTITPNGWVEWILIQRQGIYLHCAWVLRFHEKLIRVALYA